MIRKLTDRRSNEGRWLYVSLGVAIIPLTLWSMEESVWGAIPCAVVLVMLAMQILRPSLLGWFALLVLFSANGILMVSHATRDDYFMGAVWGFLPAIGLLWARPRSANRSN
jgi:hypothetical protein